MGEERGERGRGEEGSRGRRRRTRKGGHAMDEEQEKEDERNG